jgi:pre-mRNA-splicing factor ATP-dependent RNA helicase DHX16
MNEMPSDAVPEMQRSNLAAICLFMKALGIDDVVNFDFVDPPPPDLLSRSLTDLYRLGALGAAHGELTKIGLQMAEFPVDPALARVLLAAVDLDCVDAVVKIAALISLEMTLFQTPHALPKSDEKKKKPCPNVFSNLAGGDHFMLLDAFNAWLLNGRNEKWASNVSINPVAMLQADNIRRQLMHIILRLFPEHDFESGQSEEYSAVKKAFLKGYSNNIARLDRSGLSFTVAGGRTAFIHPSSCLASIKPPRRLLFHDLISTSKEFMRTVMILDDDDNDGDGNDVKP